MQLYIVAQLERHPTLNDSSSLEMVQYCTFPHTHYQQWKGKSVHSVLELIVWMIEILWYSAFYSSDKAHAHYPKIHPTITHYPKIYSHD